MYPSFPKRNYVALLLTSPLILVSLVYSDLDWIDSSDDRKNTDRYLIFFGDSLVFLEVF